MTAPSQTELNLAAALECLRLMLETQAHAIAMDVPVTPVQQWLAMWGVKL
jgi:hypothetical protein